MGSDRTFTVTIESRNGVARLAVGGELDLSTVPFLSDRLSDVQQDGVGAIMLDLRDLTFIDSMGLNAFLHAYKRAEASAKRFVLLGVNPRIRRLFEITGTEFLLGDGDAIALLDRFTGGRARQTEDVTTAAAEAANE